MRERLGLLVPHVRMVERHVDLYALRPGGFRERREPELLEQLTQPERDLAAFDDARRCSGVEVERDHRRARDRLRER